MRLRDYQEAILWQTKRHISAGRRRVLIVAPCGSGKGTLITHMINGAELKDSRTIFLVNRRELVKDMSRRLDKLGLDHGIIMGNHPRRRPGCNTQVASVSTLHRRLNRLPPAEMLVLDEAHFGLSRTWYEVLDRYPRATLIGATATPFRLDGSGLGRVFDAMVEGPSVSDLTRRGYLVPTRAYAPSVPDLHGVKTRAGEYAQNELSEAVDKADLIGDIVEHWKRLGHGRPTVCFAVDVKHSQHITQQFVEAGVRAVHVDANTPDSVRDQTWPDLAAGRVELVSSVGVISYGWDVPPVSCAILARPTQSLALYLQQAGRVLRSHPGKPDALILDHAGNTLRHGLVDDPRQWGLEDAEKAGRSKDEALHIRSCQKCFGVYLSSQSACPYCGHVPEGAQRIIRHEDGSLEEVTNERYFWCRECGSTGTVPAGVSFYKLICEKCFSTDLKLLAGGKRGMANGDQRFLRLRQWCKEAKERGHRPGYPSVMFKNAFGYYPPKGWMEDARL